jgi:hypothetical protein
MPTREPQPATGEPETPTLEPQPATWEPETPTLEPQPATWEPRASPAPGAAGAPRPMGAR